MRRTKINSKYFWKLILLNAYRELLWKSADKNLNKIHKNNWDMRQVIKCLNFLLGVMQTHEKYAIKIERKDIKH